MKKVTLWLVVTGVIVALGLGGWLYVLYGKVQASAQDEVKTTVAALVRAQAPAFITASDFSNTDPKHTAAVFGALWNAVQSPQYVRMKVWDPSNTIIWSNLAELIGQKFSSDELTEAQAGEVVFDEESQKDENVGERQYDVLGETYVPFMDVSGKVAGIVELYNVTTALDNQVMSDFDSALPLPIATAVVVYAILGFVIVRFGKKGMTIPPPSSQAPAEPKV